MASRKAEINNLGKILDNKGFIRHPTRMGPNWRAINREVWTNTTATNGRGWFFDAAERRRPEVVRAVSQTLDEWLVKLARRVDKVS
jgi:hypothetical protein